jgi:hypothetical protein
LEKNISFLNLVIVQKPFFYSRHSDLDLDPRGQKTVQTGVFIKVDFNISFLTLAIDLKPFFYLL